MTYQSTQSCGEGVVPTHSQPGTSERWVVSTTPCPFYLGKDQASIVQRTGWASGTVWAATRNSRAPGFDARTVLPVTSFYTD